VHLDKLYVKINGQMHNLWRAADHEGEVLKPCASKTCDAPAALMFMKKLVERHGRP
jgi:putative transposase